LAPEQAGNNFRIDSPKQRPKQMKKILTAAMVVLAMVSLAGCVGYGKGKAPAPVVTNG
jgi:hypothetical protein